MSLDSSLDGDRPPSRRSSSSSSDRQKSEHSSPERQKWAVDGETEPVAKKLTPRSSERDSSPDGVPNRLFSGVFRKVITIARQIIIIYVATVMLIMCVAFV